MIAENVLFIKETLYSRKKVKNVNGIQDASIFTTSFITSFNWKILPNFATTIFSLKLNSNENSIVKFSILKLISHSHNFQFFYKITPQCKFTPKLFDASQKYQNDNFVIIISFIVLHDLYQKLYAYPIRRLV